MVNAFSPLPCAGHLPPHTRPTRHRLPTQTTNRTSHQTSNRAGKTKKKGSLGYPFLFEVCFSLIARFYPPNTRMRSRTCVRLIFIFIFIFILFLFLLLFRFSLTPATSHLLPPPPEVRYGGPPLCLIALCFFFFFFFFFSLSRARDPSRAFGFFFFSIFI